MPPGGIAVNVHQVIDIVREWVETEGSRMPGFCGAHLNGGITRMSKDAPFPEWDDVDVVVISTEAKQWSPLELSYKGLILECGIVPFEKYRSSEIVLSDPDIAANIVVPSVLADPTGFLDKLHQDIMRDYACRRWVQARCQWEKTSILANLDAAGKASSSYEA